MPPANRPLKLPSRSARAQAERKVLWNEARAREDADFFTIGYAGRTVAELLKVALDAGVCSILDIRRNPVSMYRPELSKTNLSRTIVSVGLNYLHFPQLGVPRHIRAKAMATGSRQVIWDWYDRYVVTVFARNLSLFLNMADHPVALMCVEADPEECHRHRLFLALEEQGLRGFDL